MINDLPVTDASSLYIKLYQIGNAVVILLISLAIIYIVWNAVQFIRNAGGEERVKYQKGILWGVVGLFAIVSIWGLVNILEGTFGTGNVWNNGTAAQNVNSLILHP